MADKVNVHEMVKQIDEMERPADWIEFNACKGGLVVIRKITIAAVQQGTRCGVFTEIYLTGGAVIEVAHHYTHVLATLEAMIDTVPAVR